MTRGAVHDIAGKLIECHPMIGIPENPTKHDLCIADLIREQAALAKITCTEDIGPYTVTGYYPIGKKTLLLKFETKKDLDYFSRYIKKQ